MEPSKPAFHPVNVQRAWKQPAQLQSAHMMKLWRERPKIFVADVFDAKLDIWQEEVFDLYMLFQRIAMIANKGPGKTFTLAVLGWHFFITNHQPKIAALAITKDHLMSNLWAELASLHARSDLLKRSVEAGGERFKLIGHELYSFIDARSFPKQADSKSMTSALAGLHAPNVAFLLDEAGMIPDPVLATADAALSTGDGPQKKARILAAGNPEIPSGMIYEASKGLTEQEWGIVRVTGDPDDPKRSPRVDVKWAQSQIRTYGRHDPWVLVNVFGEYPPTAMDTLLSDSEVKEAMDRVIEERTVISSQTRLGIDVARGGVDRSSFAKRKGLKAYPLELFDSTHTGPQLAGIVAMKQGEERIERIFVDNTGGYGSSVIDSLQLFPNMEVTPVVYNANAQDKTRYFNKRTEMYMRLRDWVRKGGGLPKDPELAKELTTIKVIFHAGVTRIEPKEDIKKRLGRSPDRSDSLAQTFADVEQSSFFAQTGIDDGPRDTPRTDQELRDFANAYHRSMQGNFVHDESQIDKYHRPAPNYNS